MWWPGRAAREERELLFRTLDAVMQAAAAQSRAAEAQARALEAHMELFRPQPEAAAGWVNRDEDEYLAELERHGFPRHGTREEQLRWVQAHADEGQLYELRPIND